MTPSDLRFYAEFQCYPTWVTLPTGGEDNPDPHDLGLPDDLAGAVVAWSDDFDADRAAFDARGRELAERVARTVGERFQVRYHDVGDHTWVVLG
jgi:hypothetical protein